MSCKLSKVKLKLFSKGEATLLVQFRVNLTQKKTTDNNKEKKEKT